MPLPLDHELAGRMISDVPRGFHLQRDDIGDTGPSDLAKAIRDERSATAESDLVSAGFLRGHQRLWVNETGQEIIVFLYQFATEGGAQQYLEGWGKRIAMPGGPTRHPLPLPGLPSGSIGFSERPTEVLIGWSGSAIVAFRSKTFVVVIQCLGSSEEAVRERIIPLAADQFRRLA